jgi:hypothetical protein
MSSEFCVWCLVWLGPPSLVSREESSVLPLMESSLQGRPSSQPLEMSQWWEYGVLSVFSLHPTR